MIGELAVRDADLVADEVNIWELAFHGVLFSDFQQFQFLIAGKAFDGSRIDGLKKSGDRIRLEFIQITISLKRINK